MFGILKRTAFTGIRIPKIMISNHFPLKQQYRGILLYVHNDSSVLDPRSIHHQWNQVILDAEGMGCDPAPHFKRWYMKPKEARKMRVNKRTHIHSQTQTKPDKTK